MPRNNVVVCMCIAAGSKPQPVDPLSACMCCCRFDSSLAVSTNLCASQPYLCDARLHTTLLQVRQQLAVAHQQLGEGQHSAAILKTQLQSAEVRACVYVCAGEGRCG